MLVVHASLVQVLIAIANIVLLMVIVINAKMAIIYMAEYVFITVFNILEIVFL